MKLKIENMKKEPFTSKSGTDLVRVSILSGGKVYTCLEGQWNKAWAIGQEIDVQVEESTYNGKPQYKLVAPKKSDPYMEEILNNTRKILALLSGLTTATTKSPAMDETFPDDGGF
jgi:hypothetical protein